MRKPRCYIVENKKRHDLSSATVYGDVIILYETQPSDVFMLSKHTYTIKKMLEDAEQSDYLIISGNMIL